MENLTLENCYKDIVKDAEKKMFNKLLDNAQQVEHIDLLEELKHALTILNRPDYYLISNEKHKQTLEDMFKDDRVKIKILYTQHLDEHTLMLVRNDFGYIKTSYEHPLILPYTQELEIIHPEFITRINVGDVYEEVHI